MSQPAGRQHFSTSYKELFMNMKHHGLIAAALFSALLAACTTSPSTSNHDTDPTIYTSANHNSIMVGESVTVTAKTTNLAGSGDVKWTVIPSGSGAKVTPDRNTHNQTALFSADQPGNYVVKAVVDGGKNGPVSSETTVTVNAR
jgi:hypothetical protein